MPTVTSSLTITSLPVYGGLTFARGWAVYLAGEEVPGAYALGKGFDVLTTINPSEGFGGNMPQQP